MGAAQRGSGENGLDIKLCVNLPTAASVAKGPDQNEKEMHASLRVNKHALHTQITANKQNVNITGQRYKYPIIVLT